MSYSNLIDTLNLAADNTLINNVIVTDDYTRIIDDEKNKYPLLHIDITNSTKTFTDRGVMLSNYTLNSFLYLGANDSSSKATLTIDELNNLNIQLDNIANSFLSNLYFLEESYSVLNSLNVTNSAPLKTNGAQCFNINFEIQVFVDNVPCIDC